MDLSSINPAEAADQPAFLHLLHPATREPLYNDDNDEPIGVTLTGRDGSAYNNVIRQGEKKVFSNRKPMTHAEAKETIIKACAAATVSFHNVMIHGEEKNASQALEVYRKNQWILEQVNEFIEDRENFFTKA